MDHISILIVHYNTDKDTKACLDSLKDLVTPGFECNIIVLDNGSKQPFSLSKSMQDEKIELLRSEANLGFTGGNNHLIKYALQKFDSDFVVLLNSDTLVAPDFLKDLYLFAKEHPRAGLINPKIYFAKGDEYHDDSYKASEKGTVFWYAGGSIDWPHLTSHHIGVDEVDRGQFEKPQETDFVTGCCMMIRREVIENAGLLDERFFVYMEDVEYSIRAKRHGYVAVYYPGAVIWHKNAGSSDGSGSRLQQYYQTRNRLFLGLWQRYDRALVPAIRLWWQAVWESSVKRQAALDALIGNMGKKPVV